ncbi:MAG: hypothetical protein ACK44G_03205, partial [Aphanizomenon sp.]
SNVMQITLRESTKTLFKRRLNWRLNKVLVDSRKVICITFDQLARDMRDRLSLYPLIYEAESEAEQNISTDESNLS